MILKDGVDATNVHPVLWLFLGAIAARYRELTLEGLVITSLRRPPAGGKSWHSPALHVPVRAADLRRWKLDQLGQAKEFAVELRERYGAFLGVVLEPEELTLEQLRERGGRDKVAPHIHVQLKSTAWPTAV